MSLALAGSVYATLALVDATLALVNATLALVNATLALTLSAESMRGLSATMGVADAREHSLRSIRPGQPTCASASAIRQAKRSVGYAECPARPPRVLLPLPSLPRLEILETLHVTESGARAMAAMAAMAAALTVEHLLAAASVMRTASGGAT